MSLMDAAIATYEARELLIARVPVVSDEGYRIILGALVYLGLSK